MKKREDLHARWDHTYGLLAWVGNDKDVKASERFAMPVLSLITGAAIRGGMYAR